MRGARDLSRRRAAGRYACSWTPRGEGGSGRSGGSAAGGPRSRPRSAAGGPESVVGSRTCRSGLGHRVGLKEGGEAQERRGAEREQCELAGVPLPAPGSPPAGEGERESAPLERPLRQVAQQAKAVGAECESAERDVRREARGDDDIADE